MTTAKCPGLTAAGKLCKNKVAAGKATCGKCKGSSSGPATGTSAAALKAQALVCEADLLEVVDLADADFLAAASELPGGPFAAASARALEVLAPAGYFSNPRTGQPVSADQLEPSALEGKAVLLHRIPGGTGIPSAEISFYVPGGAFTEPDDAALLARYDGRKSRYDVRQVSGEVLVDPSDTAEVQARFDILAAQGYFRADDKTFGGGELKLVDVDGRLRVESSDGQIRWRLPSGVFTSPSHDALTERYAGRTGKRNGQSDGDNGDAWFGEEDEDDDDDDY